MRIRLICGVLLYYLFLNIAYTKIIVPTYYYMGYVNISPSIFTLFVASIFAIAPCFWLPVKLTRPSNVVVWVLYLFVAIPTSFVPLYTLYNEPPKLIGLEVFIMLNVVLLSIMGKIRLIKLPRLTLSKNKFWLMIVGLSCVFYAYVFYRFGFSLNIVGLDDAYDLRFEYRDESDALSRYFINWQSKVLNPFIIAVGLVKKNPFLVLSGLLGQFVLFSISGHKAYLFSSMLVLGLWVALKNSGERFGVRVLYGLTGVVIISFIIDSLLNSSFLTSMFVRRMIVTPALLTGYYYDFFSTNSVAIWGHSFLSWIIDYEYSMAPPFLIGSVFMGNASIAANANLWADGFANLGYLGMFINTFVLGLLLLLFDSFSLKRNKTLMGMLLGVSAWSLSDTALFTSILTHGIFLVILIAYVMPKNLLETSKKKKNFKIVWNKPVHSRYIAIKSNSKHVH